MTASADTQALYALFENWFQQRQGDHADPADEVIEIKLPPQSSLHPHGNPISVADISALAKRAYEQRRARDRVFQEPELFGEPVWDMLLDISAAEARGECLSVTSVCIGSCVAETTALRWIKIMELRGLTCREADPRDGRRSFIKLTEDGREKLQRYFAEIDRLQAQVP